MKHQVKMTVIDKKLFPELQERYCADKQAGACPCYNVGDVGTLTRTDADPDTVAGGPRRPHCSEAWDAVSRYIYAGLQGGSIMRGWMERENEMVCCCNDGTRPVIFKLERIDIPEEGE